MLNKMIRTSNYKTIKDFYVNDKQEKPQPQEKPP